MKQSRRGTLRALVAASRRLRGGVFVRIRWQAAVSELGLSDQHHHIADAIG